MRAIAACTCRFIDLTISNFPQKILIYERSQVHGFLIIFVVQSEDLTESLKLCVTTNGMGVAKAKFRL